VWYLVKHRTVLDPSRDTRPICPCCAKQTTCNRLVPTGDGVSIVEWGAGCVSTPKGLLPVTIRCLSVGLFNDSLTYAYGTKCRKIGFKGSGRSLFQTIFHSFTAGSQEITRKLVRTTGLRAKIAVQWFDLGVKLGLST